MGNNVRKLPNEHSDFTRLFNTGLGLKHEPISSRLSSVGSKASPSADRFSVNHPTPNPRGAWHRSENCSATKSNGSGQPELFIQRLPALTAAGYC